jgi:GAF domain-containing protein
MRETLLVRTFVELTDSLVDDYDVVDLLTLLSDRCVEVLDVAAAGIMLASPTGELRVVASSSEAMRLLEVFEEQSEEGPCPDAFRSGQPVLAESLEASGTRWPRFGPMAHDAGFRSVYALPMRVRQQAIGALNLFRTTEGTLEPPDLYAAQSLADVATIAIVHQRAAEQAREVNEQLSRALQSRIVVEQAKGMLAERLNVDVDAAFELLRCRAWRRSARLAEVAAAVVSGALGAGELEG